MNNYAYIITECRKAHYGKWEKEAVEACISLLPTLTREELLHMMSSRWLKKNDEVRKAAFQQLFKEQLESHRKMISTSTIDELGSMLTEQNGKNVKWAREELKRRYLLENRDTQLRIISFFVKGTTKQDVQWGQVREKWQQRGMATPPSFLDFLRERAK